MKKIITLAIVCLLTAASFAQVPDLMNYQAVARNNAGAALANQAIKVRLSVMKNAVLQYSETRQVVTNALGLFNVQIGSSGALATTGSFSAIDWQNNTAPGYVLKVEMDVNNSNVFTDMGSQALVSVPYSFAAKKADEATETVNIAGRPIDQTTTPAVGSRLSWNGTNWTPVKKDTVYSVLFTSSGPNISTANWTFTHGAPTVITVNGNERITAHIVCPLSTANNTTAIDVFTAICYQNTSNVNNPILPFSTGLGSTLYPSTIPGTPHGTQLSATAVATLPAGTYRIGFAARNLTSGTTVFTYGGQSGTIEVKY